MVARKTQNEINNLLAAKNITMVGAYTDWKAPVQVKCNLDGYIWSTRLQDLAKGHGCHQCKGVPRISEQRIFLSWSMLNHSNFCHFKPF